MVNVADVPGQPFIFGVTVIIAIIGVVPLLIAAKAEISPTPLAPNPMFELLLVQL